MESPDSFFDPIEHFIRHDQVLGHTLREALGPLRDHGNTAAMRDRMLRGAEYSDYLGLPDIGEWKNRFPA